MDKSSHATADQVIHNLIHWAEGKLTVRAMLLTSTRAVPEAFVDAYSDYDVILVVNDIHPFHEDRTWLAAFGEVVVGYWDTIQPDPDFGVECFGNVIQFEDGLKIDFTLWPAAPSSTFRVPMLEMITSHVDKRQFTTENCNCHSKMDGGESQDGEREMTEIVYQDDWPRSSTDPYPRCATGDTSGTAPDRSSSAAASYTNSPTSNSGLRLHTTAMNQRCAPANDHNAKPPR